MLTRRSLLGFIAASPFIVKASSLMPVRSLVLPPEVTWVTPELTSIDEAYFASGTIGRLVGEGFFRRDASGLYRELVWRDARGVLFPPVDGELP